MTIASRRDVVDRLLRQVQDLYVAPDLAARIVSEIRAAQRSGAYDGIDDPAAFSRALTQQLQQVTHDRHLEVTYYPDVLPSGSASTAGQASAAGLMAASLEDDRSFRARMGRANYGFQDIRVLDGNVGYINLTGFAPADVGWDTAVAAMGMVANTSALIIDLRDNTGGNPQMATVIATYLLASLYHPVHLNDIYWRPGNSTDQYWTLPYVPGKLYGGRDVYVLTSARTFSTAEEFAYDLQALKRVIVVGERTAGGANVGVTLRLTEHYAAFIPAGRSVNPITHANWEGMGVTPDVAVSANAAREVAYVSALKKRLGKATDPAECEEVSHALIRAQDALESLRNP